VGKRGNVRDALPLNVNWQVQQQYCLLLGAIRLNVDFLKQLNHPACLWLSALEPVCSASGSNSGAVTGKDETMLLLPSCLFVSHGTNS
jgi:hypothetical protein